MKEIAMIVVEIRYLIIYVFLVLKIKKLVCKVVFHTCVINPSSVRVMLPASMARSQLMVVSKPPSG